MHTSDANLTYRSWLHLCYFFNRHIIRSRVLSGWWKTFELLPADRVRLFYISNQMLSFTDNARTANRPNDCCWKENLCRNQTISFRTHIHLYLDTRTYARRLKYMYSVSGVLIIRFLRGKKMVWVRKNVGYGFEGRNNFR